MIRGLDARFVEEPESFTTLEDEHLNYLMRAAYNTEGFNKAADALAYTPLFDKMYANFIAYSRRPWTQGSVLNRLITLRKAGKLITKSVHTRQKNDRNRT
jgi:hypothetical protein